MLQNCLQVQKDSKICMTIQLSMKAVTFWALFEVRITNESQQCEIKNEF